MHPGYQEMAASERARSHTDVSLLRSSLQNQRCLKKGPYRRTREGGEKKQKAMSQRGDKRS